LTESGVTRSSVGKNLGVYGSINGISVDIKNMELIEEETYFTERPGRYSATFGSTSGEILETVSFNTIEFGNEDLFYFEVPFDTDIVNMKIFDSGNELLTMSPSQEDLSIHIQDIEQNGNVFTISVEGDKPRSLMYSINGGQTWNMIAQAMIDEIVWYAQTWEMKDEIIFRVTVKDGWLLEHDTLTVQTGANDSPPEVEIFSPEYGSSLSNTVNFDGFAHDKVDLLLEGDSLKWISNVDGFLGYGQYLTVTDLSKGVHEITLEGTNSRNISEHSTVWINVGPDNTPPTVTGLDQVMVIEGGKWFQMIINATDDKGEVETDMIMRDIDNLEVNISFTVEKLDGGDKRISILSPGQPGQYTIEMIFQDESLNFVSKNLVLLVVGEEIETPMIITPREGDVYFSNSKVEFTSTETDLSVIWYSDIDGYLGEGVDVFSTMSAGDHLISMEISFGGEVLKTSLINITVEEGPSAVIEKIHFEQLEDSKILINWTLAGMGVARVEIYLSDDPGELGELDAFTEDLSETDHILEFEGNGEYSVTIVLKDAQDEIIYQESMSLDISGSGPEDDPPDIFGIALIAVGILILFLAFLIIILKKPSMSKEVEE
jgi:hypothetical protein